jgi:hypothetical protein
MIQNIIILSHLGLGDNIFNISLVNYLLKNNNKVELVCKNHNFQNINYIFQNCNNFSIINVSNDDEAIQICNNQNNKLILKSGFFKQNNIIKEFPFFIYDDINISHNILREYFYVRNTEKNDYLYSLISDKEYIFVCNTTSFGIEFNILNECAKYNINIDEIIVISTTENLYDKSHKFYKICEEFIYYKNNLFIIDYKDTLINSKLILLADSSVFCFAIQLPLKYNNHSVYVRRSSVSLDKLVNFYDNKFSLLYN